MSQLTKIYLESLNNNELRVQCQRHGLPNVPVTDSSRSVLIRRLLTVAGDGNANQIKKKVTPVSPKNIDGTSASKNQSPSRVEKRHDVDIHSYMDKSSRRSNVHIEPMDIEFDNEDENNEHEINIGNNNTLYPQLPHLYTPVLSYSKTNIAGTTNRPGEPSFYVEEKRNATSFGSKVQPPSSRSSRSSSLSKSGVITTSYRQEFSPLPVREDDVDRGSYDTVPSTYNRAEYRKLMQKSNSPELPFKPVARSTIHDYPQHSVYTGKSHASPAERIHNSTSYGQTDEDSEDILEVTDSEEEATNSERYDYNDDTQLSLKARKIVNDSTFEKRSSTFNHSQPHIGSRASALGRNTTSSYRSTGDTSFRSFDRSPKVYEDRDIKFGASNNYEDASYSKSTGSTKKLQKVFKTPTRRRGLGENEDVVQTSLQQFLVALDEKYHIKQVSIMVLIFMLSVFIYAMFIQSNDQQIAFT